MADIICRWRNGTPKTVVELVNAMPHEVMPSENFRKFMEHSIYGNEFFHTPYQLACQLALYCEAEDGLYYPRFTHDITSEEAQEYLEQWFPKYYIPNPYVRSDGFNDIECPTYVVYSLYNYVRNHPKCSYSEAYKAIFHEEATNNNDIVKNYINRYSKVLHFEADGTLTITEANPNQIFKFMDRSNRKEFFDNFSQQSKRTYSQTTTTDNSSYLPYLTALRTKPFMLLAGISGTGKSLDEMNLAPVEQYFAEYLSVIESRKLQDGHIETDPIVPFENTEAYGSLIDQLFDSDEERKAYKTEEGGKRLTIPENLFVVGTVNMDETTFSFSRKVLDRAMTIEMNEVNLKGGGLEAGGAAEFGYIGEDLMGEAAEGRDIYADNQALCDDIITYLGKVNEILEGTPFKIAYRTRNEFLLYAVNRIHFATDSELWQTLDEMTSMKILSRIEGDNERCERVLREMKNLLTETVGNHAPDSVSLKKIDEMTLKLKSGYTSYWT